MSRNLKYFTAKKETQTNLRLVPEQSSIILTYYKGKTAHEMVILNDFY